MENNKLGIVISTTKSNNLSSGFRSIYSYNSDGWSSVVRDTGAELKMVTPKVNSAPIHFVQFVNNGCCYCIMQSIAGRNDYQSAWIFIHKDINFESGDFCSIIQDVEKILSLDVEDRKKELDSLFNKSYPVTKNPCYSASSGESYAVRYYGNGTDFVYRRSDILEKYLYQSDYCKYKSVFLIDYNSGLRVPSAKDLSKIECNESIVIELPHDRYGFKHDQPSNLWRITKGATVKVKWTCNGYAPIIKEGKKTEDLLFDKSERHRSFRLDLFRVVDKVTRETLNVQPKFTSRCYIENQRNFTYVYFKEDELNSIECCVDLSNYESFKGTLDLTKPNNKGEFVIELSPKQHVYSCCIETTIPDYKIIEFKIKTQYILTGTEIPGLKFDETPSEHRKNKLKGNLQQRAEASKGNLSQESRGNHRYIEKDSCHKKHAPWYKNALMVLVLLAFLAGLYYLFIMKYDVSTPQNTEVTYPDSKSEWDKALDYLNGNNAYWIKDSMESYSELKGLYTKIKDYQFNELKAFIESHKEDLMGIDSWKRLYDKIQNCNDKKGSFPASDGKIEIDKYLQKDFASMKDVSNSVEPQHDVDDLNNNDATNNDDDSHSNVDSHGNVGSSSNINNSGSHRNRRSNGIGSHGNGGSNRNTNKKGGSSGNSSYNGNGDSKGKSGSKKNNNQDSNT